MAGPKAPEITGILSSEKLRHSRHTAVQITVYHRAGPENKCFCSQVIYKKIHIGKDNISHCLCGFLNVFLPVIGLLSTILIKKLFTDLHDVSGAHGEDDIVPAGVCPDIVFDLVEGVQIYSFCPQGPDLPAKVI